MVKQYPVIITVRDRLTCLQQLLDWLESVGQNEIWLCDNASTYPPLVEFLKSTNHNVVYNRFNLGHRAPWLSGLVPELGHSRYFIISDPDILPDKNTPSNVFEHFEKTLRKNSNIDKVGFSLRIDDLPDHYVHKQDVITWESQFWRNKMPSGFFPAPIDTTFAMHRPGSGHLNANSLRSAPPYTARHLPWYYDLSKPTAEDAYYNQHADGLITNWNTEKLPASVLAVLTKLRAERNE